MNDLSIKIEALLFSEGGALAKKKLAQLVDATPTQIENALIELRTLLANGGITLVVTETEAALVVSAGAAFTVQKAFERELGREIGDAGLEVLAIILYRGPSTRAQIDYIRGVNTSSTIRTLASRGLLERAANPADAREYLYRPTVELLAHLGTREAQDLPEYAKITSELAAFEESQKKSNEPFENHATTGNTPE
jgi:segregation and condensation protein B